MIGNRPSTIYTFLPDKHYKSDTIVLDTFSKLLLKHLRNNPDGVQLPFVFLQIIRKEGYAPSNETLKRKYGKDYVMPNTHTEGEVITTRTVFNSNVTNQIKLTNYFHFKGLFKFVAYKNLKRIQKEISESNYYDFLKVIKTPYHDDKNSSVKSKK